VINYLLEAVRALAANRLRTLLALTGLVVGVGAVIAIQVLGHATSGAMAGILQGFSNNTFLVQPNTQNGFDLKSGIKLSQVPQLDTIPGVVSAIPYSQIPAISFLGHDKAQLNVAPSGSDPRFYATPIADGRLFSAAEESGGARVCVLSDNAFKKLSPDGTPVVGRQLRAGPLRCTVVGVLAASPTGAISFNFAPDVAVPHTTFEKLYIRHSQVYALQVLVDDVGHLAPVEDKVKAQLSAWHNGKFQYQTFDSTVIAKLFDTVFGVLTLIVGIIGSISLVVAGIGIMNVLLVSIAERTREIGVRKAIGGQRKQILLQFFLEAALLTFTGCLVGSLFGLAIGWWINTTYIIKISGVIVPVPWTQSVILAVVFATIVTLAFGTYPAYRAAGLDPIEALRYE
jgi:ABC-type antimicrobial peptide transport system permease subunit